jgi:hypothetical protein
MRNYHWKSLLLALCLICTGSMTLHFLVFRKRQSLHFRHFPDQRGMTSGREQFVPSGPPVEGVLAAVGQGKIHINTGGRFPTPFKTERPEDYKVGQKLRVTFAQGAPPVALKIEIIP